MKIRKCKKHAVIIPDVKQVDSFHLQCKEIEYDEAVKNGRITPKQAWYYENIWDDDNE